MVWAVPEYAWLLLLAVPAGLLLRRAERRRCSAMRLLIGEGAEDGQPNPVARARRARRVMVWLLPTVAFLLVVAALCRPQWGRVATPPHARGADILLALDVSRSMLADDIRPNRLVAAKQAIADLLPKLQGDRIGLIAFAGGAFMVCPLTTDYATFADVLKQLDPDTLPLGGTHLAAALDEARRVQGAARGEEAILVVLSDGEDHGDDLDAAVAPLRAAGIAVHSVLVGTADGGLIPLGDGRFVTDRAGAIVRSRSHAESLRALAVATGGQHFDLAVDREALASLLVTGPTAVSDGKRRQADEARRQLAERFQIPLALALLLLFIEPWVGRWGKP